MRVLSIWWNWHYSTAKNCDIHLHNTLKSRTDRDLSFRQCEHSVLKSAKVMEFCQFNKIDVVYSFPRENTLLGAHWDKWNFVRCCSGSQIELSILLHWHDFGCQKLHVTLQNCDIYLCKVFKTTYLFKHPFCYVGTIQRLGQNWDIIQVHKALGN